MQYNGALAGVKVLDLTRVLAGPFATMMLADMGAEVIKIEVPGSGDDSRQFGPFINGESSYYMNLNRNKKGVTLNLKGRGKEIFLEMVKKADIVVENYRPGTMEKLGLGYEELKKVNPKIVYGAVSGFGHYGPYKDRAGYDIIGQAMSGLMSTTGWPGGEPTRTGTAMSDILAGLSVAIGLLAALRHRDVTGYGQKVDVSLVDATVASMEIINQIYLVEGRLPQRIGNRYESTYPYDSFKANDGSLVIGAANDKLWQKLCVIMGQPELGEKAEFDTNWKRVQRHEEVKVLVEAWTITKPVKEIVDALLAVGIPAAPINNIEQVVNDPHIAGAREMFVEVDHPKAGKMKITGSHIKLSDTKPCIKTPAPLLGQHNEEVYKDFLGLSADEIAAMKKDGLL
ncbi:formyl-CoA transferase [Pelosinus fermentans]|jgi:formyl-CoA transferase|uniref:L-carnitine dehydratase/bile acid-inducible protein F n=1 Tax=Pelosinus fermentans B4 TaxID=1149862 RepID=I8RLX6_9FIRM|nr:MULTISPECIES: CoA transferase [Pelosinus]EIW19695.1 L-carnitine dehydratase/bile acid-inducible protein F [Pelosinus fermentans B4]OAM93010.1 Formyl-CoA transferase [Pelosinus fermentans DSM 17108]SDQ63993.1 formyl-CoA transferase [Pelosinus fermentans]